jgi:hypothetical protein
VLRVARPLVASLVFQPASQLALPRAALMRPELPQAAWRELTSPLLRRTDHPQVFPPAV